jgi:hypothetical protein
VDVYVKESGIRCGRGRGVLLELAPSDAHECVTPPDEFQGGDLKTSKKSGGYGNRGF